MVSAALSILVAVLLNPEAFVWWSLGHLGHLIHKAWLAQRPRQPASAFAAVQIRANAGEGSLCASNLGQCRVYSFLMGQLTHFLFTTTSGLVLKCLSEDLLELEPGQVMLERFSHVNNTIYLFICLFSLIAISHNGSEICTATCISKGPEITLNIFVFREDTCWQSNSFEGGTSYVCCEFRQTKINSSLLTKVQEIKNK